MTKILYCLFICFFAFGNISNVFAEGESIPKPLSGTSPSIKVIRHPSEAMLKTLEVSQWPTWRKEVSEFTWYFSGEETAYILEGEVLVRPEGTPESKGVLS